MADVDQFPVKVTFCKQSKSSNSFILFPFPTFRTNQPKKLTRKQEDIVNKSLISQYYLKGFFFVLGKVDISLDNLTFHHLTSNLTRFASLRSYKIRLGLFDHFAVSVAESLYFFILETDNILFDNTISKVYFIDNLRTFEWFRDFFDDWNVSITSIVSTVIAYKLPPTSEYLRLCTR